MIPKPGKELRILIEDLVEWGDRVGWIIARTSAAGIGKDMIVYLALERGVEVVGEIASELMRLYPDWSESRRAQGLLGANRMRNRLAHAYDDIDAVLLFGIASEDVRALTAKARLWLDELDTQ